MSTGTDSQVVEALSADGGLERLLRALKCNTQKEGGTSFESPVGYIHCPMPDHPDTNPSCSVIVDGGFFVCRSVCGEILAADLVIAHGHATDRAGAMKWIEEALEIKRAGRGADPRVTVFDPSRSVSQYLALKHLSAATAERFGLEDAKIWEDPKRSRKGYTCLFEEGWHGAILMPNDPPGTPALKRRNRPRVRNIFGARWPAKVIDTSGLKIDYGVLTDPVQGDPVAGVPHQPARLAYDQVAYGIAQFKPSTDPMLARTLLVYEGESDVHCSHDLSLANCLGVPGAMGAASVVRDLVGVCMAADGGAQDNLAQWTILVWAEPGAAGQRLPARVMDAVTSYCAEQQLPTPRIVALQHSAIVIGDGGRPKDPCNLVDLLLPMHNGSAAPAREEARRLITDAAFVAMGLAPRELDFAAPAIAVQPQLAELPDPVSMQSGSDPWEGMGCEGEESGAIEVPELPRRIEDLGIEYVRVPEGWRAKYETASGETRQPLICSIMDVQEVQVVDGADWLVLRAPRGHQQRFQTVRIARSDLSDSRKVGAALGEIGVNIAVRQSGYVSAMLGAMADHRLRTAGAVLVPACTGWADVCGVGPFGGIDCEPVNMMGSWMFKANAKRREQRPDVRAAALEWWTKGVEPTISMQATPTVGGAGALLALGSAAAGPLMGPLNDLGITVSPIAWLAGRGGGGKTVTQKLAASIFAPDLPGLDGQKAFFPSADISQAALSARVDSCRDLPLLLDDAQRMPPLPGSTKRGDDAKIEAGASLIMMIFNRNPVERATRDGGIRLSRPFRSSAVLSAEISMTSEYSRAQLQAGNLRRTMTIETKPMRERGLDDAYYETVQRISKTLGGSAGDLIVERIREMVRTRALRAIYAKARKRVGLLGGDVDDTQRECIAVAVLGFVLLAELAGGWEFEQALEHACIILEPYIQADAAEGGAMGAADQGGASKVEHAVRDLVAAHPLRFDSLVKEQSGMALAPSMGFLGRILDRDAQGQRRIALYRAGVTLLESSYGVTGSAIKIAEEEGLAERKQIRVDGNRLRCTVFTLPESPDDDDDEPDAPPPHDPDPHGLTRVPGQIDTSADEPESTQLGTVTQVDLSYQETRLTSPDVNDMAKLRERLITEDHQMTVTYAEGDTIVPAIYSWGQGVYLVPDGPSGRVNQSFHVGIQREVGDELGALREMYQAAADKARNEGGSYDIEVAPFPPDDDPRWAKIDAIGQDAARATWQQVHEALYARNQQLEDDAARKPLDEQHVKLYRIHLMCRYRHPEWFIVGTVTP